MLMLAACFTCAGFACAYYSISKGDTGVVLSIYNANIAIQVILSAVFLN